MRICDWSSDVCSSDVCLWHLELELGNGCATQRLDKRVQQAVGFETCRTGARDAAGRHDGSLAHYHHKPASDTQLILQGIGYVGYRAGNQYGVVFSGAPARMGVAGFYADIAN